MKRLFQAKPLFVASILYTLLLTWGSLVTISTSGSPFKLSDKVFHIIAYFGLTLVWFIWKYIAVEGSGNSGYKSSTIWIIALLTCVYGMIIEVIQGQFTDDRITDFADVIANIFGIVTAIILIGLLNKKGILRKIKF